MSQPQPELRKIIAGSSRFHAFLELLESLRDQVTDIRNPIKPTDSIETRQAIRYFLETELDLLRRIKDNPNAGNVPIRRDDT